MSAVHQIEKRSTSPYSDQKPGTSGLRKPVRTFQQSPNYTENFVQATLNSIESKNVLIVGGDGRYFNQEAIQVIIQVCAANQVQKLVIGQNGIFSTPAVSALIRELKADGGIILTASHNPGGPDGDFGIKFNTPNGGPAPEGITNRIYEASRQLKEFSICPSINVDLKVIGKQQFQLSSNQSFQVEVIDSIDNYLQLLKSIFDFERIRTYIQKSGAKLLFDSLHGVTGPYAQRVFVSELGLPAESVRHGESLPDFGGLHPDPNLTYAADLLKQMQSGQYELGVAFDGDGDRNMILGKSAFFVTPSDSLAVIAANLHLIPYFRKQTITGFARSMPTAPALDQVAKHLNLSCYEVPTGWKFFGNLMDDQRIVLCGEESFGTGSNHIREKDGMWAALCWLSILAETYLQGDTNASVQSLIEQHWTKFGRNVFTRYDYENCESAACNQMIAELEKLIVNKTLIGQKYAAKAYGSEVDQEYVIEKMDNFEYKDPVDQSVTKNQGIRVLFSDGSRIIVRLSGTGSQGATVRLYVDASVQDANRLKLSAAELLKPLIAIALEITEIRRHTGRDRPTVIT